MRTEPSTIALRDWTHHSATILVAMGQSLRKAVANAPPPESMLARGYFYVDPTVAAAVFVDRGRLKLQLEAEVFDWEGDAITVTHRHLGIQKCKAIVHSKRRRIFELTYRSVLSRAIELGDMTVDEMDELDQDWWLWLSGFSSKNAFRLNMTDLFVRGFR